MQQLDQSPMTMKTFWIFTAIAFSITWGLATLIILYTEQIEAIFGEFGYTNPVFILAVYAPAFASLGLILWHHGLRGLAQFFKRLTLFRMDLGLWLVLILGIPVAFYIGTILKGNFGEPFPFSPWYSVLPAMLMALFIGPIEEFGWRGLGLPLLQRKLVPFWAGLWLGVIWALWHIPAFLMSGAPQSGWSFPAFFIAVVSLSILITPMFNAARGSLLIPVIFHFQCNGPAWPDAQPWDTVVFVALTAVVVFFYREKLFSRESAATDVLLDEAKFIKSTNI